MAKTHTTRSADECPIFGHGEDLWHRVLPTYETVMRCYIFVRNDLKKSTNKDPSFSEIADKVVERLKVVWKNTSIPTVSNQRIEQMLKCYHAKYRNILKPHKGRSDSQAYRAKLEAFKLEAQNKLFDIAACKCKLPSNCACPKERKVPKEEHIFLLDQRSERKMVIDRVDITLTKKKTATMLRKQREQQLLSHTDCTDTTNTDLDISSESDNISEHTDDDELYPEPTPSKRMLEKKHMSSPKKKKTKHLQTVACACDRAGVSDRAAALIVSSALQDIGVVSSQDMSEVVDRNKIRRARQKMRSSSINQREHKAITGIYFDGRKDLTLTQEMKGGKYYRKKIMEEHIALVHEPGAEYMGHYSVTCGSAEGISKGFFQYAEENDIDLKDLVAIGCDGTVVNTGEKGGAIRMIEVKLNKPVHHFICQLHANELPLRHLVEKLDGKTSGPHGFTGPIGKLLNDCENLPIVAFEIIDAEKPTVHCYDLSTDQKYLLEIHQAIITGICSPDLAHRNPGKMAHSRWVTTANRLLRLYISTDKPSKIFCSIVQYIMQVYVPMWFSIKQSTSFVNGPKHILKTIELTRNLGDDVCNIVRPVIQRNAFFCHPENILAAMIADNKDETRELGWRRIKKTRQKNKQKSVRCFKVPPINFDATDYTDLIDWQLSHISEPPLTRNITDEDIEHHIINRSKMTFEAFPCHTQAVERIVKEVSDASLKVCGHEARHGYIRSRLASRVKIPRFESKTNFKA